MKYLLLLIFAASLLLRAYIFNALYPFASEVEIPFILEVTDMSFWFPFWAYYIFIPLNLFLFWLIGRRAFNKKIATFTILLYGLSPWTAYVDILAPLQTLLLFGLLLCVYGMFQIKQNKNRGILISVIGTAILLYSSILMWVIIPLFFFASYLYNRALFKQKKYVYLVLIITPLLLVSLNNKDGVKNIFEKEAMVFRNTSILNAVNQFRGDINKSEYIGMGRLIENRYTYSLEYVLFNFLRHLSPVTYFTPEIKLFDFSNTPPILIAFLIPFIIGFKGWLLVWKKYGKYSLIIFFLILPSLLSEKSLDLSRLLIFSPVIFFTISYGMDYLFSQKGGKLKFYKYLFISLIVTQSLVVFLDIGLREGARIDKVRFPYFYNS